MPNLSSNPPPDKQETAQNIDALILQVTSDPDSIMDNSPTHYETKQESNQVHWHSKKDRTQEVAFVIVGKISPDAQLGLYGDHLYQYVSLCIFYIFMIFDFFVRNLLFYLL